MASITVRNIDDDLKQRLRVRAAEHGRSMEEEVRAILRKSLGHERPAKSLGEQIHETFAEIGGVDLELPAREPPRFDEPPGT